MKPLNQVDPIQTHVNTENGNALIHQKLNRILQIDRRSDAAAEPVSENVAMISKVTVRPNPFKFAIALEVSCKQSKHIIIRMTDSKERIVKMISWFVVKGANVTSLTELDHLDAGIYCLDVLNQEGELLFTTDVEKK